MYGNQWSGPLVIERLTAAFAALPATPIYSPTENVLMNATFFSQPIDGGALIVATGRYLGFRTPVRRRLLAYCRARAVDVAIVDLCLGEGWARASLYRHVKASADTVAAGLNEDRLPPQLVA